LTSIMTVIPATIRLSAISPTLMGSISLSLWMTGFLCLLNIALAVIYRKKVKKEVFSYYAAFIVELAIFAFALLIYIGVISSIPYHLPPGLPINRAGIGAALALGIGLFPAAYWHRINLSDLPGRIAQDGKVIKERSSGVHLPPGEWMN